MFVNLADCPYCKHATLYHANTITVYQRTVQQMWWNHDQH